MCEENHIFVYSSFCLKGLVCPIYQICPNFVGHLGLLLRTSSSCYAMSFPPIRTPFAHILPTCATSLLVHFQKPGPQDRHDILDTV